MQLKNNNIVQVKLYFSEFFLKKNESLAKCKIKIKIKILDTSSELAFGSCNSQSLTGNHSA